MDMNTAEAHPLQASQPFKIVHLIRHAQGIHNVEVEKNRDAAFYPQLVDAELSPLGWLQVGEARKQVHERGLLGRLELVITSPMLRTMQTAVGIFGQTFLSDESDSSKKTLENANGDHSETSNANSLPFLAVELCRERIGLHTCDKRGSIANYRSIFPMIDFSMIETEEDELWQAETREEIEKVAARGMQFLNWVWMREEREIAVVSHGIFLQQMLLSFGDNIDPSVKSELCKRFSNCELRSVTIYKSAVESDSSTTYARGKLLCGIHLLSDISKRNALEEETPI